MNYSEALSFFSQKRSSGATLGLDRVRLLAKYLGNPEKDLRFIHITGTNGKGSVSAFLQSVLTQSGLKTGNFNSPYIQDYTEQIRVDGVPISEDDLAFSADIVKEACDQMTADGYLLPTEFEMLFCASLIHFRKTSCDIVILEVGMGGSGDATNIIGTPELAIFTPIGMDHMAWLGDTVEKIAAEKAGIIKTGGTALTAPQEPAVMNVLSNACDRQGGRMYTCRIPYHIRSSMEGHIFDLDLPDGAVLKDLRISLAGAYQPANAALAATAAHLLHISDSSIRAGLSAALWPGRFEILQKDPLWIIDGAHNPDGINALKSSIMTFFPGQKLILIVGVLADKDHHEMMSVMIPFAKSVHTVTVPNSRTMSAEALAEEFLALGTECGNEVPVMAHSSIEEAILSAKKEAAPDDVILAFGSLYYIGIIRSYLSGNCRES